MSGFSIKEDLQFRGLDQIIEILWISGPTWHNAEKISVRLNVSIEKIMDVVSKIKR